MLTLNETIDHWSAAVVTIPVRVFPSPFTHGGGGQVQVEKALMGGTHEGGHRPYGGLT